MKLQKGSLFILSTALFFALGILPIQAAILGSATPNFAYAAEAEIPTEEGFAAIEPISEEIDSNGAISIDGADVEPMPEYIDDIGEEPIGIEPIAGELEDALEGEEEDADAVIDLNEPAELGVIPLIIVVVALIASGVAAFFIATKKPKQPTVQ